MSTIKTNNAQIGQSITTTNNFTLYQPATPDGTVRLGNGNAGSVTDIITLNSSGNVGIGTSSPLAKLDVNGSGLFRGDGTEGGEISFRNPDNAASGMIIDVAGADLGRVFSVRNNSQLQLGQLSGTGGIVTLYTQGSERMRVAASGNVGIGTNNPAFKLQVTGGIYSIDASAEASVGAAGLNMAASYLYSNATAWGLYSTRGGGIISYIDASGTTQLGATSIMTFSANGAERMRIDSSGNLLVGTSSAFLGGRTNFQGSNNGQLALRHTAQAAGRCWFAGVEGGNDVFIIYPGGISGGVYLTWGATSWSGNSDERLKTDLKPIEDAANKVSMLRAVTGRFKTDDENFSRSFLIAQDVQAVLPEAVDVRDDEQGTLGIRYTDVIPLLVAAIKELKLELDATKAELAALKGA